MAWFSLSPPESPFAPPSLLYSLLHHPVATLITFVHYLLLYLRGPAYKSAVPFSRTRPAIRVVCISDTHTKIPGKALPPGDLLIHCGDLTNRGTRAEIQRTLDWLKRLQKPWPGSSDGFRHIVMVAGNHDAYFDERSRSNYDKAMAAPRPGNDGGQQLQFGSIHYLQHSSVRLPFPGDPVRWLKVYGAPQIPRCGGPEFAFQYARGHDTWSDTVPADVDVLVTHNPPKWHLDLAEAGGLGCEHELKEVWRVKPTLHAFGHVHAGYGRDNVWWDQGQRAFEELREIAYGGGRGAGAGGADAKGKAKANSPGYSNDTPVLEEVFNSKLWRKAAELIYHDVRGLLRNRVWGEARQGGIMVNAALTYQNTGVLRNSPQVVEL